jgi:hypothetical protein
VNTTPVKHAKVCSCCAMELPESAFYKNSHIKHCRDCQYRKMIMSAVRKAFNIDLKLIAPRKSTTSSDLFCHVCNKYKPMHLISREPTVCLACVKAARNNTAPAEQNLYQLRLELETMRKSA